MIAPFALFASAILVSAGNCPAQLNYVARFTIEKRNFILGEPIFCNFVIQNTGERTLSFRFRAPDRAENRDLESEPQFRVTTEKGRPLPDPAPKPCGGAKGSVVYGSVTLPPGKTHSERWLLNQWARITRPGRYHVRGERRLPLFTASPGGEGISGRPVAYASALDEMTFTVAPSTEAGLRAVFEPYGKIATNPGKSDVAEAALVLTTLPEPFFQSTLEFLARAPADERRWQRNRALEGLARLGTPAAWNAIEKIAAGVGNLSSSAGGSDARPLDDSLRAYAILLMGERADAAFLPTLFKIIHSQRSDSAASENLGGDALRALGFFHKARANELLFEKLHAPSPTDRVNAILGLKNLDSKDSIPALIAMLRDPDTEVREVANFALHGLTDYTPGVAGAKSDGGAHEWDQWWQKHAESFVPRPQPSCHDW